MTAPHACPCGSAKPYAECCGRWHDGPLLLQAPDAEALMRSRYCAFVLERADYLLATWHPRTRPVALEPTPPGTSPNPSEADRRWLALTGFDGDRVWLAGLVAGRVVSVALAELEPGGPGAGAPLRIQRRIVLDDLLSERESALSALRRLGVDTLDLLPEQITAPVLNRYLAIRYGPER